MFEVALFSGQLHGLAKMHQENYSLKQHTKKRVFGQ